MQSERERRGEIKYRFTPVSRSSIKKDSLKADRAVQRSLMCKVNRTATPSHHHSEKKKKKQIHTHYPLVILLPFDCVEFQKANRIDPTYEFDKIHGPA